MHESTTGAGERVGLGVVVGVGFGVGIGPWVIVSAMGAELFAWVPETSLKTTDPFHSPAGIPFTVSVQLPLDALTADCNKSTGGVNG